MKNRRSDRSDTDKKESAESDIQASAEELTATFNKNAEEKDKGKPTELSRHLRMPLNQK